MSNIPKQVQDSYPKPKISIFSHKNENQKENEETNATGKHYSDERSVRVISQHARDDSIAALRQTMLVGVHVWPCRLRPYRLDDG